MAFGHWDLVEFLGCFNPLQTLVVHKAATGEATGPTGSVFPVAAILPDALASAVGYFILYAGTKGVLEKLVGQPQSVPYEQGLPFMDEMGLYAKEMKYYILDRQARRMKAEKQRLECSMHTARAQYGDPTIMNFAIRTAARLTAVVGTYPLRVISSHIHYNGVTTLEGALEVGKQILNSGPAVYFRGMEYAMLFTIGNTFIEQAAGACSLWATQEEVYMLMAEKENHLALKDEHLKMNTAYHRYELGMFALGLPLFPIWGISARMRLGKAYDCGQPFDGLSLAVLTPEDYGGEGLRLFYVFAVGGMEVFEVLMKLFDEEEPQEPQDP